MGVVMRLNVFSRFVDKVRKIPQSRIGNVNNVLILKPETGNSGLMVAFSTHLYVMNL